MCLRFGHGLLLPSQNHDLTNIKKMLRCCLNISLQLMSLEKDFKEYVRETFKNPGKVFPDWARLDNHEKTMDGQKDIYLGPDRENPMGLDASVSTGKAGHQIEVLYDCDSSHQNPASLKIHQLTGAKRVSVHQAFCFMDQRLVPADEWYGHVFSGEYGGVHGDL